MATILRGAPIARAMTEQLAERSARLSAQGTVPTLAILRVGEREDDLAYERGAIKRCGQIGIAVRQFPLAQQVTEQELLETIDRINADPQIHGCLLFRPLPKQDVYKRQPFTVLRLRLLCGGRVFRSAGLYFPTARLQRTFKPLHRCWSRSHRPD